MTSQSPPPWRRSFRTRLILWNVATMALLLVVLGTTLHYIALGRLQAGIDDQLVDQQRGGPGGPPHGHGGPGHDGPGHEGPGPDGLGHDDHDPGHPDPDGMPSHRLSVPGMSSPLEGMPSFDHGPGSDPRRQDPFRQPFMGRGPQPPKMPKFPETIDEARQQRVQTMGTDDDKTAAAPTLLMTRTLSPEGVQHFPDGTTRAPWDPVTFARSLKGESVYSTISVDGEPVRVYSAPRSYRGVVEGVIQSAATLTETNREVGRITIYLLTLLPFALIGVALTGAFLAGRALRPVQEVTDAAERIEARNLSGRMAVTGEDEFGRLALTFNAMLERLDGAFSRQRRFTADASHELRTPLTVIKTNSSLALSGSRDIEEYRQSLQTIDQAADMMTHIVGDLLFLARAEADASRPVPSLLEPVLLDEVLSLAVGTVRDPGCAAIEWEIADSSLQVRGDRFDLIRVFVNLLSNAMRYTPPEGHIRVFAHSHETDREGDTIRIEVSDTGTGIAPEHLSHVFEPFYRADPSRARQSGGAGLGLPICRTIVEAHGGEITLDSTVGQGTTVRVRLPRYAPELN